MNVCICIVLSIFTLRMHMCVPGVKDSVCLSVDTKISKLRSESLIEGLVQDRSVRIQRLHNSQTRDPLERLRIAA